MWFFLKLVGAFVLAILIVGTILFLWLRSKAKRFFESAARAISAAALTQPPEIHLQRVEGEPDWDDPEAVEAHLKALLALGYEDAGCYTIEEIEVVRMQALLHPEEAVVAVISEHDMAGIWVDLMTLWPGGQALTVTNNENPGMDRPPDKPIHRFPGASVAELHANLLAARDPGPYDTLTAGSFAESFERYYREEMEWRAVRGGPTEEEIRRVAEASNIDDEEVIRMTRDSYVCMAESGLAEKLKRNYLESGAVSAADWDERGWRTHFVFEQMTAETLMQYAEDMQEASYEDMESPEMDALQLRFENGPKRKVFADFLATVPAARRFRKIGEVHSPVDADVYEAPAT